MRKVLLVVIVAVLLTAGGIALGVALLGSDGDTGDGDTSAPPLADALADVDTTTMTIQRADFCANVPEADLTEALGGDVVEADSYGNGDRAEMINGTTDVAHEYACTWTGPGKAAAAAWVFAPPVTRADAAALAEDTPKGCRIVDAPAFGRPSSALACGKSVTFRGLFGDAWLSCQLAGTAKEPRSALLDRAGRFCVSIARAAA